MAINLGLHLNFNVYKENNEIIRNDVDGESLTNITQSEFLDITRTSVHNKSLDKTASSPTKSKYPSFNLNNTIKQAKQAADSNTAQSPVQNKIQTIDNKTAGVAKMGSLETKPNTFEKQLAGHEATMTKSASLNQIDLMKQENKSVGPSTKMLSPLFAEDVAQNKAAPPPPGPTSAKMLSPLFTEDTAHKKAISPPPPPPPGPTGTKMLSSLFTEDTTQKKAPAPATQTKTPSKSQKKKKQILPSPVSQTPSDESIKIPLAEHHIALMCRDKILLGKFKEYLRKQYDFKELDVQPDLENTLLIVRPINENLSYNSLCVYLNKYIKETIKEVTFELSEKLLEAMKAENVINTIFKVPENMHLTLSSKSVTYFCNRVNVFKTNPMYHFSSVYELVKFMSNLAVHLNNHDFYLKTSDLRNRTFKLGVTNIEKEFLSTFKEMFNFETRCHTKDTQVYIDIRKTFHSAFPLVFKDQTVSNKLRTKFKTSDLDKGNQLLTLFSTYGAIDAQLVEMHEFFDNSIFHKNFEINVKHLNETNFNKQFMKSCLEDFEKQFPLFHFYIETMPNSDRKINYYFSIESQDYVMIDYCETETVKPGILFFMEKDKFWMNTVREKNVRVLYFDIDCRAILFGHKCDVIILLNYIRLYAEYFIRIKIFTLNIAKNRYGFARVNKTEIEHELDQKNIGYYLDFERNYDITLYVLYKNVNKHDKDSLVEKYFEKVWNLFKIVRVFIIPDNQRIESKNLKTPAIESENNRFFIESDNFFNDLQNFLVNKFPNCFLHKEIYRKNLVIVVKSGVRIKNISRFQNRVLCTGNDVRSVGKYIAYEIENNFFKNYICNYVIKCDDNIESDIYSDVISFYYEKHLNLPKEILVYYDNWKIKFDCLKDEKAKLDELIRNLVEENFEITYSYEGNTVIVNGEDESEAAINMIDNEIFVLFQEDLTWKALLTSDLFKCEVELIDKTFRIKGMKYKCLFLYAYLEYFFSCVLCVAVENTFLRDENLGEYFEDSEQNYKILRLGNTFYVMLFVKLKDRMKIEDMFTVRKFLMTTKNEAQKKFLLEKVDAYKNVYPPVFIEATLDNTCLIGVQCLGLYTDKIKNFISEKIIFIQSGEADSSSEEFVLNYIRGRNQLNIILSYESRKIVFCGLRQDVVNEINYYRNLVATV